MPTRYLHESYKQKGQPKGWPTCLFHMVAWGAIEPSTRIFLACRPKGAIPTTAFLKLLTQALTWKNGRAQQLDPNAYNLLI